MRKVLLMGWFVFLLMFAVTPVQADDYSFGSITVTIGDCEEGMYEEYNFDLLIPDSSNHLYTNVMDDYIDMYPNFENHDYLYDDDSYTSFLAYRLLSRVEKQDGNCTTVFQVIAGDFDDISSFKLIAFDHDGNTISISDVFTASDLADDWDNYTTTEIVFDPLIEEFVFVNVYNEEMAEFHSITQIVEAIMIIGGIQLIVMIAIFIFYLKRDNGYYRMRIVFALLGTKILAIVAMIFFPTWIGFLAIAGVHFIVDYGLLTMFYNKGYVFEYRTTAVYLHLIQLIGMGISIYFLLQVRAAIELLITSGL